MTAHDDGSRLVIDSPASRILRFGAWFFAGMSVLWVVIIVVSLVTSKTPGVVDCDRARGDCEVHARTTKRAPIADIREAVVRRLPPTRNSSAAVFGALVLRAGPELALGEPAYHDDAIAAYRSVVAGVNAFLGDASQPRYRGEYIAAGDEDWIEMVFFVLVGPPWAYGLSRLSLSIRIELDRGARTVRSDVKVLWRKPISATLRFDQVSAVLVSGSRNWGSVTLRTAAGPMLVARLPRAGGGPEKLRRLVSDLAAVLAVPVDASPEVRERWALRG